MVSDLFDLYLHVSAKALEGGSMFSHRYRASDYQNSWPKNYHELSNEWSNEKNYHRLSIMKNLNMLKLNDSKLMIANDSA